MVRGSTEVWGRRRRRRPPWRPPRRPPPTYIPPIWMHDGCLVEHINHHVPGSECVIYKVIHGHCHTTTIIILYDPCRNVTFRVPYDAFKYSWRKSCRPSWGISQLMRARCRNPEEVEDGRW